jgi:hypothetical protein
VSGQVDGRRALVERVQAQAGRTLTLFTRAAMSKCKRALVGRALAQAGRTLTLFT